MEFLSFNIWVWSANELRSTHDYLAMLGLRKDLSLWASILGLRRKRNKSKRRGECLCDWRGGSCIITCKERIGFFRLAARIVGKEWIQTIGFWLNGQNIWIYIMGLGLKRVQPHWTEKKCKQGWRSIFDPFNDRASRSYSNQSRLNRSDTHWVQVETQSLYVAHSKFIFQISIKAELLQLGLGFLVLSWSPSRKMIKLIFKSILII